MPVKVYIAIAVILAILLDLSLLFWMRRKKRGSDKAPDERMVYVFGAYSPALSWLKNLDFSGFYKKIISGQNAEQPSKGEDLGGEGLTFIAEPRNIPWQVAWKEWTILFLAVILFAAGIMDWRADTRLPGNEAELFQTLDWTLLHSLKQYRQFPLWNPYAYTGLPFIADPMLHVYNPFVSVPVLLYGVRAGFKMAVFLSFLLAAFGMWRLGSTLGFSPPVRLWAALTFAFAGQPVARFFQGQYLFVFGFAWIPWITASLILLAVTRRRMYLGQLAVFLALLFFSGNAYYPFYAFIACGLFALVMSIDRRSKPPFVRLNPVLMKVFAQAGVLTLGLIAIQLIPLFEFWPHMSKDLNVEGSHSLGQIFLDYTSKDTFRSDAFNLLPAREEFYTYIGIVPVIGLLFLPLAFNKRVGRLLIFFVLLLVLVIIWVRLDDMPWRNLILNTRILIQFRHLLRILIFGSFAVIILAAFTFDRLWRFINRFANLPSDMQQNGSLRGQRIIRILGKLGIALLAGLLFIGVGDLFLTNRTYVRSEPIYQPAYQVVGWLRQHDPGEIFFSPPANNQWYDAVASHRLRNIENWYAFNDIRRTENAQNSRPVTALPHYIAAPTSEDINTRADFINLAEVAGFRILQSRQSLPMAFSVENSVLRQSAEANALVRKEVTALSPYYSSPNEVEVIAAGSDAGTNQLDGQTLVVLITQYPGWQIRIDGRPSQLKNVSGYLGVDLLPGVHKYVFGFRPYSFYLGLFLSLAASGVTLYLLFSEMNLVWRKLKQRLVIVKSGMKERLSRFNKQPGIVSQAYYQNGVLRLDQPLEIPPDTLLTVTVEQDLQSLTPSRMALRKWEWASIGLVQEITRSIQLELVLFALALLVYLAVRLAGLTRFPIYFFTDEAIQTLLAADFLRDGLTNGIGEFLPTYFRNVDHYNLSTSVYMQVLPVLLFGKSVFVTRLTPVLFTILAAGSVSLMLKKFFKLPHWWIGALVLSTIPAWFLHSRTAFETGLMVSFYSAGLLAYLRYRMESPKSLYTALVFFALAFYTYSPGQAIVAGTGLLLLFSDLRYHWKNRAIVLKGLGLLLLLALPYLRFRWEHPAAIEEHLANLNSYWLSSMPLEEKFASFAREYLYGLSPGYWFFPNGRDLVRHLMKGYGHVFWLGLPFATLGFATCLWKWRSSSHRMVVATFFAAPIGAAFAQVAVTRALVMVIPLTIMMSIGIIASLSWLEKKGLAHRTVSSGAFLLLGLANLGMLRDALINAPTWYQDYGLGGMQFGGSQLYGDIQEYLEEHPGANLIVSPAWANGPDILARFFLGDPLPVQLGNIEKYLSQYLPFDENVVFVMIPSEYIQAVESGKFTNMRVEKTTLYPNGEPGFYFVRMRYVEGIQAMLESERQARRQLQESTLLIGGEMAKVRYSMLDIGNISEIMDGNVRSLTRTLEANPYIIEITFEDLHPIGGLSLVIGDTEVELLMRLFEKIDSPEEEFHFSLDGSFQNPQVAVLLDRVRLVKRLYLEIKDKRQEEPGHVHVWEIILE